MKISYNWLKNYININLSAKELADNLTNAGIEVEDIIDTAPQINNVLTARIESVENHPNADKLKICHVESNGSSFQVICGAPNVAKGQIVPFAKIGAILPNGLNIKKAKIRGVESFGMICSREELGLEESSEGIWVLEDNLKPGLDINEILNKNRDTIFDLFITPNRPDCMSHLGIAREIAAFTNKKIKLPAVEIEEKNDRHIKDFVKIQIEYSAGCPRYCARVIENVTIKESPVWLKTYLTAVGLRPINNVVDVTNFVLHELGQPLHAFDLDKLADNTIIVKKSRPNEKFVTLDDKERNLPENTVMICDAKGSVAIGGVMGGQNSEVSDETKNILLESAYFNPGHIAKTSRGLNLTTDASQRFERGADYNNVIFALNRAARLISDLSDGKIMTGIVDQYPKKINEKTIKLRPERVNKVLGTHLSAKQIKETLAKIKLNIAEDGDIIIPSYRVDLVKEVDLIEEVARLVGYDNISTSEIEEIPLLQRTGKDVTKIEVIRENLVDLGLTEVISNSMLSEKYNAPFTSPDQIVKILNPISDDLATLRSSLIPGLLHSVSYNKNRQNSDIKFFEIGRTFKTESNSFQGIKQHYYVSFAITGDESPVFWKGQSKTLDFYDLKGYLESLFEDLLITGIEFDQTSEIEFLDKNISVLLNQSGKTIGVAGKISSFVEKLFDINDPVFIAELQLDALDLSKVVEQKFLPFTRYPYVEKDIAFIVSKSLQAIDITKFIKNVAGNLLTKITIFDLYEGEKVGPGKKSIAFRLRFESKERTLNDVEVDKIFKKIINECKNKYNATLREY